MQSDTVNVCGSKKIKSELKFSPPALIDNGRHDKCMYICGNSVIFMIVCLSQQHLITLKEMVALSETVTVLRNNAGKLIANVWPFLHRSKEAIKSYLTYSIVSTIRYFAKIRPRPCHNEQTPCCNEVSCC